AAHRDRRRGAERQNVDDDDDPAACGCTQTLKSPFADDVHASNRPAHHSPFSRSLTRRNWDACRIASREVARIPLRISDPRTCRLTCGSIGMITSGRMFIVTTSKLPPRSALSVPTKSDAGV